MSNDATADLKFCPICRGVGQPLLSLPAQPIYQHPVPHNAVVPEPHLIDLGWDFCTECAHAWQPEFDARLLENIYRSHYYTPAPEGIGMLFRNDFLAALEAIGVGATPRVLLEIGASDGDVLAELKRRTGASLAYAFEPNRENAAIARQRGLDVRESFFGADAAGQGMEAVDLVYSRHVIEHVFDLESFFGGLDAVATPEADLVLETPSLDYHALSGSIAPFHIEHLHVFALRSLALLAHIHHWELKDSVVSSSGNLIAAFSRGTASVDIPAPYLGGLQATLEEQRAHLRELFAGRRMIFWGAGSAGIGLANTIGREPDIWTDGNPNKIGKRFVGAMRRIVSPENALAQAATRDREEAILVIASSFASEILPQVQKFGWQGDVYNLTGTRLLARQS